MGTNAERMKEQPKTKSKEDALSLVRRLPLALASDMALRKRSKLPLQRPFKPVWVELRGSTLLFYTLPEGSTASTPRGKGSKVSGFRTPRGTKHNSLLTDEAFSKGRVKASDITLVSLKEKEIQIKSQDKKNVLVLKNVTDDPSSGTKITFEMKARDHDVLGTWLTALTSSQSARTVGLTDFEIIASLGKGASGKVFLVKDKLTGEQLALKVIEKSSVYETNDAYRHALDERLVLELATEHPFILNLNFAFQSDKRLYLVTEYCAGRDLFDYLKARGRPLPEKRARRLVSEIILALEHIHSLGVIYRDLKLENVLLDAQGHVRVADFGLSKLLTTPDGELLSDQSSIKVQGARTFCGTREYVAPEMLLGKQYGQSVDLWALGILTYEVLCGRTPFYASNRDEVYDRIESAPLKFPRHLSSDVVGLIRGLLDRNPKTRLGMGTSGMNEVKNHPFFKTLDWVGVYDKEPSPDGLVMNPESGEDARDFEGILEDDTELGFWIEDEREQMETASTNSKRDIWNMFVPSRSQKSKKAIGIAGYEFSGNSSKDGSQQPSRTASRAWSRANSERYDEPLILEKPPAGRSEASGERAEAAVETGVAGGEPDLIASAVPVMGDKAAGHSGGAVA
eukprot:CAMPEP_0185850844 /NCGR_PEP_ID=MMETSP1354-20130828/4821_1 /TAXON_ID=708628 /ORGANISM="Erythrolobus madagascarensis, Strain CCMP3276" /LENGTH=624 /DNA_ID=CAMNT_0028551569 /DNA_START=231 /DNA_END=2105 /DNA_ORIENTATION=+